MNCFKFLALDGALQFLEYYMEKGGFLNSINTDGNSPLLVLLKNHSRINDERQKKEVQIANIAAYFMKIPLLRFWINMETHHCMWLWKLVWSKQ